MTEKDITFRYHLSHSYDDVYVRLSLYVVVNIYVINAFILTL